MAKNQGIPTDNPLLVERTLVSYDTDALSLDSVILARNLVGCRDKLSPRQTAGTSKANHRTESLRGVWSCFLFREKAGAQ